MDPITAAAIGQATGGGIANLASLFFGGDDGEAERRRAEALLAGVPLPQFNTQALAPPTYSVTGELLPEVYQPRLAGEAALLREPVEGREAALGNLRYLESLRDEGLPLAEELRARDLQRKMAATHSATTQTALSNLARRGRLGGGLEAALRASAGQQSTNLGRDMADDLVRYALERRAGAARDVGQASGQLRLSDLMAAGRNQDAQNRYNEWSSNLMSRAAEYAANQRANAQAYNIQNQQNIANQNIASRYNTQLANLNRSNQLGQQQFANQFGRAQAQAGALGNLASHQAAQAERDAQRMHQIGTGIGAFGGYMLGGPYGKEETAAQSTPMTPTAFPQGQYRPATTEPIYGTQAPYGSLDYYQGPTQRPYGMRY